MKRASLWLALGLALLSVAPAASAQARVTGRPGATAPTATSATTASATVEGVVNINAASEEELRRLPGVGPSRATAIVALRQRVQRFRAADDLMRVRGIGRVGMRRMRPYVTLAGETTLSARPGRAPSVRSQRVSVAVEAAENPR